MKQIWSIVIITFLASNIATAQENGQQITGPTCIQIGDTVVYQVSKPIPGYHWSSPSGLNWLYSSADNSNATYIVNAMTKKLVIRILTSIRIKNGNKAQPFSNSVLVNLF